MHIRQLIFLSCEPTKSSLSVLPKTAILIVKYHFADKIDFQFYPSSQLLLYKKTNLGHYLGHKLTF